MTARAAIWVSIALWANAVAASAAPSDGLSFERVVIPADVPAHLCSALTEDLQGFVWIGTQAGLVRYDGYQFRVHEFDPKDPHSLAGNYVRSLFAASDGRLWVGTFSSGLSAYDPTTERFERYQHSPTDPSSLAHNRVEGIAEDRSGRLWIATFEGLDRLDPRSGRLEHFRHDPKNPTSLAANRVRAVLVDRTGRVWVGNQGGLQVERRDNRGRSTFVSLAAANGLYVSKLFEDSKGRIWIGTTEHGAAVFDPRTGRFVRFRPVPSDPSGLSHFWVYGIAQATPGEIWIATFGGGIDIIDTESLTIIGRLRHDAALPETIGSDRVGALWPDSSGVMWVGTWGQGLARHDPRARAFRAIRFTPSRPNGLTHPEIVRALARPDGTIWAGTNGNGIDVLDSQGRRIDAFRPDPKSTKGTLADGAITCLAAEPNGAIWVATLNGTLHRLPPGSRVFDRLTTANGLPGGPIRALVLGPDGQLWAGSAEGLARIDPQTLAVVGFRHRPEDSTTLSGIAVEALAFDARGTLWVGTDNGLNAFDPRNGTAVRIPYEPERPEGLPAAWIPDLMIAKDGRLWVATPSGAAILTSWDGQNARFETIAERLERARIQSRAAASVEALIEDHEGQVWLGPRLRVNPKTWSFQEFGPADGVAFHEFFIASRSASSDGALLFGSPEGLLITRPERLAAWTFEPRVVATSLSVDGIERLGAARLERLTIEPSERNFRLEFAALDLSAPARNRYRYRLVGYDPRWTAVGAAQRSASYTRVPPGRYTLEVQGTNRAGFWSPHALTLPVSVLPAFHQTAAFRAVAALALLGLASAGYRFRVRHFESRSRALEQLVDERTHSLAEKNRELKRAYQQIEEASLTDPLTRLHNRRFLEQGIAADLDLAVRHHESAVTANDSNDSKEEAQSQPKHEADVVFLLLDLDHFKSVNDSHGHAAGDRVLAQAADLLRATCRSSDRVVRWGGEEFLIVARSCPREHAGELAEKLRAAFEQHRFVLDDGSEITRTASLGFAAFPFSPTSPRAVGWQEVVAIADLGLYAAKRRGRNVWVGIEADANGDPAEIARRFREDPERAIAEGAVRVRVAEGDPRVSGLS